MADVVVCVPKSFGLRAWMDEGQLPNEPENGLDYYFSLGSTPKIEPGERVYVVYDGKLRGYAPLVHLDRFATGGCALVRRGGAVAVTIDTAIPGFRGFRYRFWDRSAERPFTSWRIA